MRKSVRKMALLAEILKRQLRVETAEPKASASANAGRPDPTFTPQVEPEPTSREWTKVDEEMAEALGYFSRKR